MELRQHAIEYVTRIPPGIVVRHFTIHAQKRIAIFFERKRASFVKRISEREDSRDKCGDGLGANTTLRLCHLLLLSIRAVWSPVLLPPPYSTAAVLDFSSAAAPAVSSTLDAIRLGSSLVRSFAVDRRPGAAGGICLKPNSFVTAGGTALALAAGRAAQQSQRY
jgi:hypothetical protein